MDAPVRSETAAERRLIGKLLAALEMAKSLTKEVKKASALQDDPILAESAALVRKRVKKALKAVLALQQAWDSRIERPE